MRKSHTITISGAGSTRVPALVGTFVEFRDRFPVSKFIFYDIDNERTSKTEAYIRLALKTYYSDAEVIFTTDEDLAYSKTDFVFCQMRVGKSEMRSYDEKIPLKYGLVGQETCGAGGFSYGMRSLTAMIDMVKKVRSYSAETWILNYTNPAAIVAYGLQKVFPEDKRILNLCDQPYSLMRSFAKILKVDQKELSARYFGLNHFGWFTALTNRQGKDVFVELKEYLINHEFKPYNAEQRAKSWLDTYVRVNKYMQYIDEYIPTTYMQYYFFQEEIVAESNPNYTRVDESFDTREKEVWDLCKRAEGKTDFNDLVLLNDSVFGNLMVEVAESIAYDLNEEFIVLVQNNGLIDNFEEDAIVEVAGTIGKDGPKGYPYGPIKTFYKGLMENQYAYERLTVEACLEGSYVKALQALSLNRAVNGLENAKAVLDDFIEVSHDYWKLK
jgi:maltose-6'-phosphate glucosidase